MPVTSVSQATALVQQADDGFSEAQMMKLVLQFIRSPTTVEAYLTLNDKLRRRWAHITLGMIREEDESDVTDHLMG